MRKQFLLIVLLAVCFTASSQYTYTIFYNNKQYKVDQKSIVKDSAGKVHDYNSWANMLTTGEYDIRPVDADSDKSGFLLVKLSSEEQMRRIKQAPKPRGTRVFTDGKKIASFSAFDMNGAKVDLKELKGKIVVLNFWFIRCPPCRLERPYLNQLVQEYKTDSSVVFIAVALDPKFQLENFLKDNPFDYQVIPDGREIADNYMVDQYPTHVILNDEGRVAFHTISYNAVTGYWLRKTIDELKTN